MAGLSFLKKAPTREKILNKVVVVPLDKGVRGFHFHPFIESYKHIVTPKVLKEEFGLFSVSSFYRNGVTDNEYQVTIVLPAVDDKDARNNYNKVQRFKKLVSPTIKELQNQLGLVKMSIYPMMKKQIGYITAVDEEVDLDAGFANGYPKVIKISFTFAVDEMYAEVFGRAKPDFDSVVASQDQTPQDNSKKNLAQRAATVKANKKLQPKLTPKQLARLEGISEKEAKRRMAQPGYGLVIE
tara:strand:+ start:1717 stop:2436 length:720 start_codon:yes stop_codon:yes gene_type:complete